MPWETNIELEIGDVVWHTFMEVDTMIDILVDDEPDELYKLIRYDDIYLAKRGDELIPLNGYCLCEEIKKEQSSNIEVISVVDDMTANPHGVDMTRGKIAYIGRPNKKYRIGLTEADLDGEDIIEVGDIIIKRRSDHHIRLEEDIHNKLDKMYFIIQRKDMYAKYEKSNSNNS